MDAVTIPIWIALIGLVSLIVTLVVAPILTQRAATNSRLLEKAADAEQARRDKDAERIRQQRDKDEDRARLEHVAAEARAVAAKADAAALLVADAAKLLAVNKAEQAAADAERARLLVESNQKIADAMAAAAKVTNDKVDATHDIMNSAYTGTLQSELNMTKSALLLAEQVIELKKQAGQDPNGAAADLVATLKSRSKELEMTIANRLKQQNEAATLKLATAHASV